MSEQKSKPLPKEKLTSIDSKWGENPNDHFGYASDEERRAKRGMEDWELLESIPESQKGVPKWFIGVVIVVLLVAIGLSFPFWGDRPGYERDWVNWGFVVALIYIGVASVFVFFMVRLYGSKYGGRLDLDKTDEEQAGKKEERHD
jgi:hypothetical protein